MSVHLLDVAVDPGGVPAGRRFAASALAGTVEQDVAEAAELVVTELLTNALLHGAGPVRLLIDSGDGSGRARIEVHDGSRSLPVAPRHDADGMTGRGLALVDALSCGWGFEPADHGKVVWAEVTPESVVVAAPGDVDLDALLAGFEDDEDRGPARFPVVVHDVPTQLLLAAEDHVDSVVRELTLATTGGSATSGAVPASLAGLVRGVVAQFAPVRQAAKRQALAAADRGARRTSVQLTLPAGVADVGERYLAALEEADAYGRASRLLTLAASPQHAVFRRWYVMTLVQALRCAAEGQLPAETGSFEDHLLAEVDHLAGLRAVSGRAARLQGATAALAVALDPDEVTRIALSEAVAELGATRGIVLLALPRGVRVAAQTGFSPAQLEGVLETWQLGEATPSHEAWLTGRPVWVESREERDRCFPVVARVEPESNAMCAVPLTVAGDAVAVMRLSFAEPRMFEDDERAFLTALAAVAAQALERADLYDAQSDMADRLVRLQAVASALARTHTVDEVLDVTVEHAVGLVGAHVATLGLLHEDAQGVEPVRVQPAGAAALERFTVDDDLAAARAIRSGLLVTQPGPAGTVVAAPLQAEGSCVGVLTLSFASLPEDEEEFRDFLTAFADACAQALQRARAADAAGEAHRRLSFLARASEELAGALDIDETLGKLARLIVPELADWSVVHLLQDDELACVAIEHRDPELRDRVLVGQQRWPELLDDAGVSRVVRTGRALLVPSVGAAREQAREAGVERDRERLALLDGLGLRSVLIAPLNARGRTLGTLTFATAESGRVYGAGDVAYVEDLARRAAVAVDNARLYAVAARSVAAPAHDGLVQRPRPESLPGHPDDDVLRWHLAQEAGRLGSWDLDVVSGALSWDEQCAELFGTTLEEFEGAMEGFAARTHPEDLPRVLADLQRTMDEATPLEVEHRALLRDGSVRHLLSRGRAVTAPDGKVVRVLGAVVDVTELREALRAESDSARVLAGLGDVALRLAAAHSVEDLTRVVVEHGLVVLGADGGAVCVRDEEAGVLRLALSESLGPDVQTEFGELPLDDPLPAAHTARTGETVLLPTRRSGLEFSAAMDDVYEATGRHAWVSLPLAAAGRVLGSLVVSWTEEREFPTRDQELLAVFAAQCAQTLDRIRTLEAERRAAAAARRLSETLQRSLLTRPPEPDHLQIAVRYVPASQEAQVGGDWYDAFFTRDGAMSLVIGDCTGHDRKAVAAMAAVRNLLRATTYAVDDTPAAVLAALEQTMAGLDVSALATALLARVDQDEDDLARGVRSLIWSSAGHLPPLLRAADGTTEVLASEPDLMLGLVPSTPRADHRAELEPGSTLLLYTDGLVERRGEDLDEGVARLRRAFAAAGAAPLEEVCDALLAELGHDAEDDVALLALRCHAQDRPRPAEAGPEYVPDARPLDR